MGFTVKNHVPGNVLLTKLKYRLIRALPSVALSLLLLLLLLFIINTQLFRCAIHLTEFYSLKILVDNMQWKNVDCWQLCIYI